MDRKTDNDFLGPLEDGGPIILQMNKKADCGKTLVASKHISKM